MIRLERYSDPDYSRHPAYGLGQPKPAWRDRLRALRLFLPPMVRTTVELFRRRKRWAVVQNRSDRLPDPKYRELYENGIAGFRLAREDLRHLVSLAEPHVQKLRETRAQPKAGEAAASYNEVSVKLRRSNSAELHDFVHTLLEKLNVFRIAEAYNGYRVGVNTVCVQINDATDTYWTNHFRDIGLKDPATSYMHVDSSVGYLKCIFYLNPVSRENGCFRYVRGSHRVLKRRIFDFIVRRANDMSKLDKTDAGHRNLFRALPRFLQRKAEMGNDFFDGTPMVEELLRSEALFTSEDGDMVLFDTDGIHRGAIISTGERLILQVTLVPVEQIRA